MNPTNKKIKNTAISATTMVGPTGVPAKMETSIPVAVQTTETIAELMVTDLNDLKTRILLNAGKIINAEISKEPTRFIAKTMMTAVTTAIIKL